MVSAPWRGRRTRTSRARGGGPRSPRPGSASEGPVEETRMDRALGAQRGGHVASPRQAGGETGGPTVEPDAAIGSPARWWSGRGNGGGKGGGIGGGTGEDDGVSGPAFPFPVTSSMLGCYRHLVHPAMRAILAVEANGFCVDRRAAAGVVQALQSAAGSGSGAATEGSRTGQEALTQQRQQPIDDGRRDADDGLFFGGIAGLAWAALLPLPPPP